MSYIVFLINIFLQNNHLTIQCALIIMVYVYIVSLVNTEIERNMTFSVTQLQRFETFPQNTPFSLKLCHDYCLS